MFNGLNEQTGKVKKSAKKSGRGDPCKMQSADLWGLLTRLSSLEKSTYNELVGEVAKDYNIAELPTNESKARLEKLNLDDRDVLSRLRIDGPGRLYGFLDRATGVFKILWWDKNHQVWPSNKKNT